MSDMKVAKKVVQIQIQFMFEHGNFTKHHDCLQENATTLIAPQVHWMIQSLVKVEMTALRLSLQ